MNRETREELIAKVERFFPETARVLRESSSALFDRIVPLEHRRFDGLKDVAICLKALRARRDQEGRCRDCERKRTTGRYCELHAERNRNYNRKSYKSRRTK